MDRYDGVIGPVRDRMASIDGNQPGDPPGTLIDRHRVGVPLVDGRRLAL
jgi:hypothetical protein